MSDTVQKIKDRLSIVDVVGGYIKLERAGQNMRARCPFHAERTPSFMVSPERGTYHCFGCGVGGDIFSFVEAIEGLDFKGALRVLAERAGVQIEYGNRDEADARDRLLNLMETAALWYEGKRTDEQDKYLRGRGLSDATIRTFRIGWAGNGWDDLVRYLREKHFTDKDMIDAGVAKKNERGRLTDKFRNRIMFPISDSAGRVIAFSGRSFGDHASPEAPKYLNSPETLLFHKSRVLYGFDKAKMAMRKLHCAILVEGQLDLIMSHQAGWENTVAASGTAFTEEHAVLIKRMTENIVICLDADQAGVKATGRAARAALRAGLQVKVARLPQGLDPADFIKNEGPEKFREIIRNATHIVTFLLNVLSESVPQKDRFRRAVETIVLPFVQEVQSPIEREQYVQEVAGRLGVSVSAVGETLKNIPTIPEPVSESPRHASDRSRIMQLMSILAWQETLPQPVIDTKALRADLINLGMFDEELFVRESARLAFEAERIYGAERSPAEDTAVLLGALRKDILSRQLLEITEALRQAEAAGDSETVASLMERSRLLTIEIAKFHKTM